MVQQLVDCSLSFATMLEEARGAESDADFISKCSISLKECRESWTRMRVCVRCRKGPERDARALAQDANELIAILTTIIKNKRRNVAAKRADERAATAAAKEEKRLERQRERRRRVSADTNSKFQIPNS
jgi:four helix bundle protein